MQNKESPNEKAAQPAETKRWPVWITFAFLLVLTASFLPWGTIRYNYTSEFMLYMHHPGLCNRILADNNRSGQKDSTQLPLTGSAWKAGFDISGFYIPHWILVLSAVIIFAFAIIHHYQVHFFINLEIPRGLSYFGLIHVVASAWGFASQGDIGSGLVLTAIGYVIFIIMLLRYD